MGGGVDSVLRDPGWQRSSEVERETFLEEEASGLSCDIQVSLEDEQQVSDSAQRDSDSCKDILLEAGPACHLLSPSPSSLSWSWP